MAEYTLHSYNSGINHLLRFLLILLVILCGIFLLQAPELFSSVPKTPPSSLFPVGDQMNSGNTTQDM